MSFSAVPVRGYGTVNPSWWNSLRSAGLLIENWLNGFIVETQFTLANNQSSFASITGLLIDPTLYGAFYADYRVYRKTTSTGATELAETGIIKGAFSPVANTWEWSIDAVGDAGMTFNVTALGQVQYKTSNITGTASASYIRFKARTISL